MTDRPKARFVATKDLQKRGAMSEEASFSRVTRSAQPLYGPRKLLICGFTPEGLASLDKVMAAALPDLPLVYARSADLETPLQTLFACPDQAGRDEASQMPAAIIMAGITENELHSLINTYRRSGLPSPLWATLTPISEKWILRQLLQELVAERAAVEKAQQDDGKKG